MYLYIRWNKIFLILFFHQVLLGMNLMFLCILFCINIRELMLILYLCFC